jgi:hypothetical protein
MTAEENEPRQIAVESNSERYGNNAPMDGVFSEATPTTSPELNEETAAESHSADKTFQKEM